MRLIYLTMPFALAVVFASTVLSQPLPERDTSETTPEQASSESSESNDVEDLKREIATMKAQYDAKIKEYDAKFEQDELDELSNLTDEELEQTQGITQGMRVSGFFDTTFSKNFIPEDVAPGRALGEESTFFMQNFNVILTNNMTRKLSFLGEVRFTFLPNGEEPEAFSLDERMDTTVIDPHTQERFKLGGLAIERVNLKWMPWEFFGVIVGYYQLPMASGIWTTAARLV